MSVSEKDAFARIIGRLEKEGRSDDREVETIHERFRYYRVVTKEAVDFIDCPFLNIDGSKNREEVLIEALDSLHLV